ncbi:MAG: ubiquinone-binding protein [Candidatus Dactylopiibacterium carminicum]|uniref:Ubiquinone-binding protein n=1 Tax=Candidatus Dactylopiibacterium carminicum TaxID=857335 RepID=A0A272EPB0_9RHOO|nr:type II toxin-antitoxin system RatA family toxin [Candidatus Dactylopiibacterium carminicum]KAF7598353.1 ubiquinone-binding protein [Candidatus Dactylopiibacterium carminicum]PAS91965.1 MAG: ubiquinone-binding protein [Candidatus Dactylopiibacterium carminicum]PAS95224.1 MAG: ubiquinone-binding protein [Candidatus Dactylopiibacterium carminicum]PAS97408.1 MAG: ubiquinone-binding protein [Candidatus Dactylopiibacterium carminicum]
MAQIQKSVLVEHSADDMYRLVNGVEDYPAFLPWCAGADVSGRSDTGLLATLHINYHGIKAHFSTVNENEPGRSIRMRLREGPFRQLDGEWRFTPLGEAACKVEFALHYEFSGHLLEKVLGPVFNHIANSFVEAFVKRAEQLVREKRS